MDYKELLGRIRKIEVKMRGLSQQQLAGQYHSRFRGRGMAFSEVRSYQIGDDVRDIDWNVTARHATPFVKVFEEEREQTVMLLFDLSSSLLWGGGALSKRAFQVEVAATLAFSAIANNDKVGAILFSDKIEEYIPPRSGKKHILRILRSLLNTEKTRRKTDLDLPLRYLMQTVKKRAAVFLLSDFMVDIDSYRESFSMASGKHDLVSLRITDPREQELPRLGLTLLQDAERGISRWVDTSSRGVRKSYEESYVERLEELKALCQKQGVDHVALSTAEDYFPQLINLFKRR